MDTSFMPKLRLDLFEGGAAGAAAAGGDGAAAAAQGEAQAAPAATRRGKSGGMDNVVYGKQAAAPDAGGQETQSGTITTSDALEAKRRAYQELIQGEYKDLYTEDTQRMINRRFRETKQLEEETAKARPVMDMLYQRYGIQSGDADGLMKAIEGDSAYWAEAADEAGMTVEQYMRLQKLERENRALTDQARKAQGEANMNAQLDAWYREADAVKATYPGFDLQKESGDPRFIAMLKSGVPMEHAYKVLHLDEIVSDVSRTSAAATEQRVVDSIRAKGARPRENGTASQSAFTVKDDVSKLTKQDRREIARLVARGERISF